jgi:hypothetical protein
MVLARESEGYAAKQADATAPGLPCECCPLDLAVTGDDLLLAFRNNDGNVREHWVARAPGGGTVTGAAQVTTTEGTLNACPMEGPRLLAGDGVVHAVWSSVSGASLTYVSSSSDGGKTWAAARAVSSTERTSAPTMASSSAGLWATFEVGASTWLAFSGDGGASFAAPVELATSDGPLGYGQADSGGGVTVVVGTTESGQVWLYRAD